MTLCGPNHIHQIFCDFEPALCLACTDMSMILIEDVIHPIAIISSVLIIAFSYIRIITVVLRIPSFEGCQKAFSASTHLLGVFLVFSVGISLMHLPFFITFPPILDIIIALMFAVLATFLTLSPKDKK